MSIDVNGNDNSPEWGYCTAEGCKEDAFPIWLSGDYPDDPDLLLCPKHIGARILHAETAQKAWTEIGARAEADAGALRTCLLAIRADAADYGPEPQGITKGYVWAGALLREIDAVLEARPAGAALLAELEAARAVVEAARCVITHKNRNECVKIDNALLDYDYAMKARET